VLAKRFKSYRFCFVKAFPRTETGKVKRKELQQQVLNRITHRN
jgi:acyl-coenzyme A synthetase/AMP-(fatty) acid ligase